jgi:hypothetical protein
MQITGITTWPDLPEFIWGRIILSVCKFSAFFTQPASIARFRSSIGMSTYALIADMTHSPLADALRQKRAFRSFLGVPKTVWLLDSCNGSAVVCRERAARVPSSPTQLVTASRLNSMSQVEQTLKLLNHSAVTSSARQL